MISCIETRIHYWESRRTQFLQLALGIIAASLAGIVAITPEISGSSLKGSLTFADIVFFPLFIMMITLIFTSIGIVSLWNKQNNPSYPFTKALKIWRWQYRYAEGVGREVNTDIQDQSEIIFAEEINKFQQNMLDYKNKTINSDMAVLYNQNLSQLYLLITNEKYKIKFVSKLRDKLLSSLRITLIICLVAILITLIA